MNAASNRNNTFQLVMAAMIMGLIILSIFLIRIPIPFTQGYVNLSDGIIFIGVFMLANKGYSIMAAALGSMLGDILGGFAMWAPWTFAIKGIMALIVVFICRAFIKPAAGHGLKIVIRIIAMAAGGLFMAFGYFVAEGIMYGNWAVALLGIPWNIGQFALGVVVAVVITEALEKTGIIKKERLHEEH